MDHRIRIQGTADLSLALRSAANAGLSQTEVARRLRTHQPSISALENEISDSSSSSASSST